MQLNDLFYLASIILASPRSYNDSTEKVLDRNELEFGQCFKFNPNLDSLFIFPLQTQISFYTNPSCSGEPAVFSNIYEADKFWARNHDKTLKYSTLEPYSYFNNYGDYESDEEVRKFVRRNNYCDDPEKRYMDYYDKQNDKIVQIDLCNFWFGRR